MEESYKSSMDIIASGRVVFVDVEEEEVLNELVTLDDGVDLGAVYVYGEEVTNSFFGDGGADGVKWCRMVPAAASASLAMIVGAPGSTSIPTEEGC